MTRYIFGFFAVIIAISLAAFTKPQASQNAPGDYYFEFDAVNHAPTQANIENPQYWIEVSNLNGCNGADEMACRIQVPEAETNPGSPRTLKSTAVIPTEEFDTDVFYVVTGNAVLGYSNRAQ